VVGRADIAVRRWWFNVSGILVFELECAEAVNPENCALLSVRLLAYLLYKCKRNVLAIQARREGGKG